MPRKTTSNQTSNQTSYQTNKSQNASNSQHNDESSFHIINVDAWDVHQHNCGLAKVNKSGQGKSAPLTYNKKRFYLKVPRLYCPFGASKPKPKPGDKEPENPSWSVQMSFGDDELCKIFQNKVNEFDQFMIDQACQPEYQVSWLGASKTKPFIREIVESKYTHMLKYVKKDGEINHEYPPFIRAQFATTFKPPFEFSCEIYDKDNQLLKASTNPDADDCINKVIPNGCYCSALLTGSIWANATGFGVTWKIAQLKVFPLRGLPKGKCLVDDPDDDVDDSNDNSSNDNQNENDGKHEESISEENNETTNNGEDIAHTSNSTEENTAQNGSNQVIENDEIDEEIIEEEAFEENQQQSIQTSPQTTNNSTTIKNKKTLTKK